MESRAPTDEETSLLADLHRSGPRQGPGGDAETELALSLARLRQDTPLNLADLGCGTGASTLRLAELVNARITAVDQLAPFLDVLRQRAIQQGVAECVTTVKGSIDALPFASGELDLIWSEGAIYNIGFENGIAQWRRYLKPGGVLVVSEIIWTTGARPLKIQTHWEEMYSEIDLASMKLVLLERHGYSPVGFFVLPEHCWVDHYYRPLQSRFEGFLSRYGHSQAARSIVAAEQREIELYDTYKAYYGYGMFIARRSR